MQHSDRETIIDTIVLSIRRDLTSTTKDKILKNPYIPYNEDVIFDLMGKFAVQRRTAKEWLVCAQIRFAEQINKP